MIRYIFITLLGFVLVGCQQGGNSSISDLEPEEWELTTHPWMEPDSALVAKAEGGDAVAQVMLGDLYMFGFKGVKPDDEKAVAWYQMAMDQDSPYGYFSMAYCFYFGYWADVNEVKTKWLLKKSHDMLLEMAEDGDVLAQNCLGEYYLASWADSVDTEEGLRWTTAAAEGGYAIAQLYLARYYYRGDVVPQSDSLAVMWYERAAAQGHDIALYELARHYLAIANEGDDATLKDENYARAYECLCKSAEMGNSDARYLLACFYFEGLYVEQDEEEALRLMKLAALQGNADAQNYIGYYYDSECEMMENSSERAAKWYMLAARQGNADALNNLATLFLDGEIPCRIPSMIPLMFRIAACYDVDKALTNLSICYMHGIGVERNTRKAYELINEAAEKGEERAVNAMKFEENLKEMLR